MMLLKDYTKLIT